MSTAIATRLTELRKEKKLSQKDAAKSLGVSQALLSHYEKGIRECGLDFLCRASAFYDVSSDYLLGITDSKFMSDSLLATQDLPQDNEVRTSTIFRASVFLSEKMNKSGKGFADKIRAIYILTLYQVYISGIAQGLIPRSANKQSKNISHLASGIINLLLSEIYSTPTEAKLKKNDSLPLCVETILNEANVIVEKSVSKITSKNNKS